MLKLLEIIIKIGGSIFIAYTALSIIRYLKGKSLKDIYNDFMWFCGYDDEEE